MQKRMEKLDVKDKKILYELDIDSRQSFSQLGKKVGLHKDVVAYRVKKLQEKGVIKNFYTFVSSHKLGYSPVKFYFNYQNVTPAMKQEIIEYLVKNPYTQDVLSAEGQYELCVVFNAENVANFYNIWKNIINKYKDYFSNQIFCVHNFFIGYKKIFLLDEKSDTKEDRINIINSSGDKKIDIDNLDKNILKFLVQDSRMPTLEIAQKLNSTVTTINSRIQKLVKTGVIQKYTINIDWPKIGYQWYKADIVLKNPEEMQQIVEYIVINPNLIQRVGSLGYTDLELMFFLNNVDQLHQIIEDLSSKFPGAIKNYKYHSYIKIHKFGGNRFFE